MNAESTQWLADRNIQLMICENKGWDFGMWHYGLMNSTTDSYERIALVNDSCILFKPLTDFFNWLNASNLDLAGITDSSQYTYHLQSYFIVMNKRAIAPIVAYFKQQPRPAQGTRDSGLEPVEWAPAGPG